MDKQVFAFFVFTSLFLIPMYLLIDIATDGTAQMVAYLIVMSYVLVFFWLAYLASRTKDAWKQALYGGGMLFALAGALLCAQATSSMLLTVAGAFLIELLAAVWIWLVGTLVDKLPAWWRDVFED